MGHRHWVLLVEDDADTRDALSLLLEHNGYDVTVTDNGRAALDALRSGWRPCVILLDLSMPYMSGYAFRQAQLHDPRLADIPVLVVSGGGWANEADVRKLGLPFFRKPMDLDAFMVAMEEVCRPVAAALS